MLNTILLKIEGGTEGGARITNLELWRDVKCLQVSFWGENWIQRRHKKWQRS